MTRFVVGGSTAVVTGAAGGIGYAVAHELSKRGARLVLLDRDADGLAAAADRLHTARPTRPVTTYVVDLADRAAALAVAQQVRDGFPDIHLLVNNAGVALEGRLDQVSLEDFEWVVDVNFRAVVTMTHTLLPNLKATPGAHIANLSSLFGIIAPGGQVAYSSSKFAVRGFGDALRQELAPHDVGVTTVHPGGIRTQISESARVGNGVSSAEEKVAREMGRRLLTIDPAVAATRIVDGVVRRKPRVLIGASAHALDAVARIAPGSYGRLLVAWDARLRQRIES